MTTGEWLRPDHDAQVLHDGKDAVVQVIGSEGSTWSTAEERRANERTDGRKRTNEPHKTQHISLIDNQPATTASTESYTLLS